MFTPEEIAFMRGLGLDYNFDDLSDDEWIGIEETIGDTLLLSGLDINYNPNAIGLMCEEILAKIP